MTSTPQKEKVESMETRQSDVSDINAAGDNFRLPSKTEVDNTLRKLQKDYGVTPWKLQLKVDCCIVLPICLLYLLSFIDRVNISNAKTYGLNSGPDPRGRYMGGANLEGNQFNVALALFFCPYVVFEVPANWLLKKLKPHVWLSLCIICFGAVTIAQGFVTSKGGLYTTRVLLGLLESGMFPGCFYLLGGWLRRDEALKRYCFFFASTSLAGAFAGLIAYGMNTLDGKQSITGWRWIFIVEGAITCACGIILFFLIADFPEDAKFLTENERAYQVHKLQLDQGRSLADRDVTLSDMLSVFKDWKVHAAAVMYFGSVVAGYSYAYFATSIIQTMHQDPVSVQVYSIYPWLGSFGGSIIFGIISDYIRHRFLFTILTCIICIAGFAMIIGINPVDSDGNPTNVNARYAACFLVVLGAYSFMPIMICWTIMNLAGHHRKMVGSAWIVGFGNIGGIVSAFIFTAQEAPKYTRGAWTCLALMLFSLAASTVYFLGVYLVNKRRSTGAENDDWDKLTDDQKALAGDLNPQFVYVL